MALTVEQKKQKLVESVDWFAFTDQQRDFLTGCAEGLTFAEACIKAYPKSKDGVRGTVGLLLSKPPIKEALISIGIGAKRPLKTRQDILQVLSDGMDNAADNDQLLKFINTFAKLSGWDKAPEETPETVDVNKLVEEVAATRRKNSNDLLA